MLADPNGLATPDWLADGALGARRFADVEGALEWCENGVLQRAGLPAGDLPDRLIQMVEQELTAGMTPAAVAVLETLVTTQVVTEVTILFSEGDAADSMFFVAAGQVSIDILVGPNRRSRLTSIGPGRAFGELSTVDGGRRSSRAVTDAPTLCHVFTRAAMNQIEGDHPDVSAA